MSDNKTAPTSIRVDDFLRTVSEQRQDESKSIIRMMQTISGEQPVMWGPSIVGFGKKHYRYDTGREGDTCLLGFSPRKAAITIYIIEGFDGYGDELQRLGKTTHSVSCLYIKKLTDIDMDVLDAIIKKTYAHNTSDAPIAKTVDDYISRLPSKTRPMFDELRMIVKSQIPHAKEVLSYGIIGYKIDDKRARVYISGWKDHVAVYPVPKSQVLATELKPYIKGKGTLWFPLGQPLPQRLIRVIVSALVEQ